MVLYKLTDEDEAIAQHRMISSLPPPHKSDLNFLQLWLVRPGMGDCAFRGGDRDIYEGKHASGLGTLATRIGEIDPLTRFLLYALPRIYHCAVVSPLYNLLGKWVKVNHHVLLLCLLADTYLSRNQKFAPQSL